MTIAASPPSVSTRAPAQRLDFIDGLRGLAVGMVIARHYYVYVYDRGLPRWSDVLGLGYLGVNLFLVLSGFCIAWPYVGASQRPFSAQEFVVRRATRILPAYYVALGIALLVAWPTYEGRELAFQVLTHLTMTHNLFPRSVLALCGPFWSLALESQLYVCFPLLLGGFRRAGALLTLAVTLGLQTIFRVYALRYGTGYSDLSFVVPWSVAGRVFEFALGMWAASLVARRTIPRNARWIRVALFAAMAVAFGAAKMVKARLGVTHPLTDALWTAGFVALLLGGSIPSSALHAALTWKPLVRLGVMSYSVYLVHALILGHVIDGCIRLTGGRVHPLALAPVAVAIILGACFLFYAAVEAPAIAFFRSRVGQRRALEGRAVAAPE